MKNLNIFTVETQLLISYVETIFHVQMNTRKTLFESLQLLHTESIWCIIWWVQNPLDLLTRILHNLNIVTKKIQF